MGDCQPSKRARNADDVTNGSGYSAPPLIKQPAPCPSPNTPEIDIGEAEVFKLLLQRIPSESGISPVQVPFTGQLVQGIFDIKPPTPQFPIKTEPNSSPSSPYHNPSAYSPSATPGPSDVQSIYTPMQPVPIPSTSTLPTFGETWHPTPDYRTTLGGLGGGTFITQQPQQSFEITQTNLETMLLQVDRNYNRSCCVNPSNREPLDPYGNVLTPINNPDEMAVNNNEASVEQMVDSSDLVRTYAPVVVVASTASVNHQNVAAQQALCDSFSNSMNISGENLDIDKFVNKEADKLYGRQN